MSERIPAGVLPLALVLGGTALVLVPSARAAFGDHAALKAALLVAGTLLAAHGTARGGITRVEAGLGAFAVAGLVSALLAGRPAQVALAALAPCVCLPWLLRSTRVHGRHRTVAGLVVAVACVVSALALLEALGVHWPWAEVRRPQSTLGNRNFVAAYALIALPLALSFARGPTRAAGVAATVLLAATVGVCRCRGVWVAAVAAAACWALVAWLRRADTAATHAAPSHLAHTPAWQLAALALVPAVVAASAPWPGLRYMESAASTARRVLEYDQGSGRGRIEQHQLGFEALRDAPLFGAGPGGWEAAAAGAAHALPERHATAFSGPLTPNSEALRVVVEHGVAGALLLGATFLALLLAAVAAARRGDPRAVALPCALVAAGVISLFDASLGRPEALALCALIGGMVEVRAMRASVPWPWLAPAVALTAMACLAATCLRAGSHLLSLSASPDSAQWSARQRTSLALFPRAAVAERLAVTSARQGRCQEARAAAEVAAALSPHHWGADVELSRCFARAGEQTEASRSMQRARGVEPHLDAVLQRPPGPEATGEPTTALATNRTLGVTSGDEREH